MFGNPFSCLPNITSTLDVVGLYLHACSCYNEQAIDNMRFPMRAGRESSSRKVMLVNLSKQTKNNLELAQIMKSLVSNMFYDTIGIEDE